MVEMEPRKAAATMAPIDTGKSVLIVDDEPGVRHLMRRWLESRGYAVAVAPDADRALAILTDTPMAVALCDLRMPGHDGLWLIDQLRRDHPDVAVIIATGVSDVDAAVEGLRQGVVDFLTKPFDRQRLLDAVARGVEWHRAAADSRKWQEALEDEMRVRHARIADTIARYPVDSRESLDALLELLTEERPDAYSHAQRVAARSAALAGAVGLSEPEVALVEVGALLHDLGKLAVPPAIIRKPAPLTAEERRLIRMHPRLGCALVERVRYLASSAAVVRDAHERLDGRGYPNGSRGDAVWIGARIVTVVDAYDTMTRARVFRDAMSDAAARKELERCAGTHFDPRVVAAFLVLLDAR
jgi:response regulator RpfG family c-di-GMP phosphodiesterase